jgi:hypothetical protein
LGLHFVLVAPFLVQRPERLVVVNLLNHLQEEVRPLVP